VVGESCTTTAVALQDNQLMSKHCVLGFNPHPRLEWRCQDGQNEVEQPDHPASLNDSCPASHPDKVFGMHRVYNYPDDGARLGATRSSSGAVIGCGAHSPAKL